MSGITVRPAERADAAPLGATLARAFFDDPAFVWLLPLPATRQRRLRRSFWTILLAEVLHHRTVEVACEGDRIVGGALWLPPGHWRPSLSRQLLGLPGHISAFGRRIGYAQALAQATVRSHPREPHWYLHTIGVDPGHQGRGVGSALLQSRLRRCDKDTQPAYLESSKARNVPLYERFGFQSTGRLELPAGAPVITTMWRPA